MALVRHDLAVGGAEGGVAGLREIAGRAQPPVLAGDRVLPVPPPLAPLLPRGGLQRGTTVAVSGAEGGGATSLALALAAGVSTAGGWCAAVGAPSLGVIAAAETGIALERFPLVAAPAQAREWATVTAALLDAFEVVLAWPPAHLRPADARRLSARARERGAVLIACGRQAEAAGGADLRLSVVAAAWEGLGQGHGHLVARRVEVVAAGRGAAARERRAWLWLPAPGGGVAAADDAPAILPTGEG